MKKLPFSWNLTQLLTINNFMTMCMSAMKDLTWQKKRVTKSETCLKAIWTSSPHFARSRALKPPMRFNPNRRWSTTTRSLVSSLTQQWSWLRQFSGKRWCYWSMILRLRQFSGQPLSHSWPAWAARWTKYFKLNILQEVENQGYIDFLRPITYHILKSETYCLFNVKHISYHGAIDMQKRLLYNSTKVSSGRTLLWFGLLIVSTLAVNFFFSLSLIKILPSQ